MLKVSNYLKYIFLRYLCRVITPKALFLFAVKKHGKKVVLMDGDRLITMENLNREVNKLCHALMALGIQKGDRIGILLQNRKEYIEIRLASYKYGFIFCALIDDFTSGQVIETLNDTDCKILFYDERLKNEDLERLKKNTKVEFYVAIEEKGKTSESLNYYDLLKNSNGSEPQTKILPDEISAIGFTSGTTGKSKGIVWTHQAWMYSFYHFLLNSDSASANNLVFLHVVPFSTAGSLVILPALACGAKNILLRSFDIEKIAKIIDTERITNMVLPPSFLIELWDFYVANAYCFNFKSLKNISVGSAALPGNKWKEMIQTFGPIIQQSYGMAEVLAPLAFLRIINPVAEKDKLTSVGKVIKQVKIKLKNIDPENKGIICIRSRTAGLGYWKRENLTQQRFQNGWFMTDDIGRISKDGNLYIIERASNIFMHKTHKIIPRDIEEIIHYFPGVKEVVVVEKDSDVIAYISTLRNFKIDLLEIEQFCLDHLPQNMVPVKYILLENLPHSSSGKILKESLKLKGTSINTFHV